MLALCAAIALNVSARATHIIGGSLYCERGGGDIVYITLVVYRDCYNGNPGAQFDDPASVGLFDLNGGLIDDVLLPFAGDDTLNLQNVPVCLPLPANVCVHRAIYQGVGFVPSDVAFQAYYQRCCRSVLVKNLEAPLSKGATFWHRCEADLNRAARLKNSLPFFAFASKPFVFDASAVDLDGDSLVYRLVPALNGGGQNVAMPQPPDLSTLYEIPFASGYGPSALIITQINFFGTKRLPSMSVKRPPTVSMSSFKRIRSRSQGPAAFRAN